MDRKLILLAADECEKAYKSNVDLGQAEYSLTLRFVAGKPIIVLATPGSNELADWLWNLWLWSVDGVKSCSHKAAESVWDDVMMRIVSLQQKVYLDFGSYPEIMVTGHSKDAPTAMWLKDQHPEFNYCVAFCPPPAFRKWKKPTLYNTVIVTDRDDPVPFMGELNFDQPDLDPDSSKRIYLPKDKKWYDVKGRVNDHLIQNIKKYFRDNQ